MRVKLLTFRYSATLGGFDDTPLREFIRDKEVLAFREHFFSVNDTPHFACVLTYQDATVSPEALEAAADARRSGSAPDPRNAPIPAAGPTGRPGRFDRPDPAVGLAEPDRVLFNTLREWRSRKARADGVPPYVVLTNRQLIEIVVKKPESRTALAALDGIGTAKVERYGAEILAGLHGARPSRAPTPPASDPGSVPVAIASVLEEAPA